MACLDEDKRLGNAFVSHKRIVLLLRSFGRMVVFLLTY